MPNTQDRYKIIIDAITDYIRPNKHEFTPATAYRPSPVGKSLETIRGIDKQPRHSGGRSGIELLDVTADADDVCLGGLSSDNP